MSPNRTLVWQFYKPLLVFNLVFSFLCLLNLYYIGISFIGLSIFVKLIGYSGAIAYKQYFSFKTNIYYNNAGYSVKKMYQYAFGLDMGIYLLMVTSFYLIKHGAAYFKG
jgi:hypothetical protein